MKKLITAGALVMVTTLALAGCGGTNTPAPGGSSSATSNAAPSMSGSLTIWVDSNRQPVIAPIAEEFTKATGVKVELVTKDNEKIRDDFISQAPTGKGPDIIVGAHDWTGKLVQSGVIAPIELGSKAKDFEDVSIKAFTYDGKVYGVPYSIENIALVRNTTLAPNAPKTFDELLTSGKQLVTDGKAKKALLVGMDPKSGDPYHLYPLQASFGAPVFTMKSDGSYDAKTVAMGGEGGTKFATLLQTLGKEKILDLNLTGDIAKEQFTKGQAPYWITGPWNLKDLKASGVKYSIEAIPSAGGKDATPFVGVQGFFINSKSANKVAASKFLLDYIGTEKNQTALANSGFRAPANKAAFAKVNSSDKDIAAFGAVGTKGVPMPNIPQMDAVWTDWGSTEAALIKGEATDPAKAWSDMVTSIQNKIK